MYGCESWTIKKAECQRIDAFELWCWRRLLRVPWTAKRSNQSILKEISPGCSLVGPMLKLKLQYFGHLMWRADLFQSSANQSRKRIPNFLGIFHLNIRVKATISWISQKSTLKEVFANFVKPNWLKCQFCAYTNLYIWSSGNTSHKCDRGKKRITFVQNTGNKQSYH